jgi:hypothetical protein
MPRRDGLRRRRPFRNPLPRILIVCEGTRTEPGYFNELRHTERIPIDLKIRPGGVPKTLVQRAVDLKDAAKMDAKTRQDENLLYDDVWCVFDIDEHPAIPDAKQQARDNGSSWLFQTHVLNSGFFSTSAISARISIEP